LKHYGVVKRNSIRQKYRIIDKKQTDFLGINMLQYHNNMKCVNYPVIKELGPSDHFCISRTSLPFQSLSLFLNYFLTRMANGLLFVYRLLVDHEIALLAFICFSASRRTDCTPIAYLPLSENLTVQTVSAMGIFLSSVDP
jgi:hypothetical protein